MIDVKFPIKVKDLAKVVDQANINPHTMKTLEELYSFYIENCIDEDKGEIPLSFNEWVSNHGEEELNNQTHTQ